MDAVLGPDPQPVTELELGDRAVRGVGGETGQPHTVRIPEPQLGSGVRSFLPDDQPHALGPAGQEVAGEFGDPGAIVDFAAGLDGRRPGKTR